MSPSPQWLASRCSERLPPVLHPHPAAISGLLSELTEAERASLKAAVISQNAPDVRPSELLRLAHACGDAVQRTLMEAGLNMAITPTVRAAFWRALASPDELAAVLSSAASELREIALDKVALEARQSGAYANAAPTEQVGTPVVQPSAGAKPAQPRGSASTNPDHNKVRAYGTKAAVQFEWQPEAPSVRIEMARCVQPPTRGAGGAYNWKQKVVFALGSHELLPVLAVLLRHTTELDLKWHGEDGKKSLRIAPAEKGASTEHLAMSIKDGDSTLSVKLPGPAQFDAACLLVRALATSRKVDESTILSLLNTLRSQPA